MRAKIVVNGESGSGKSSLVSALLVELARRFEGKPVIDDVDLGVSKFELAKLTPTASGVVTATTAAETVGSLEFWEDSYNLRTERLKPLLYPRSDTILVCVPLDRLRKDPGVVLDILHTQLEKIKHMQTKPTARGTSAVIFIVGCRKDLTDKLDEGAVRLRYFGPRPIQLGRHVVPNCHWWRLNKIAKGLQNSVDGYLECSATTGEGVTQLLDMVLYVHPRVKDVPLLLDTISPLNDANPRKRSKLGIRVRQRLLSIKYYLS